MKRAPEMATIFEPQILHFRCYKITEISPTINSCIPNKAQNMVDKHPSRYKFNSSYSQDEKQFWRCQKRSFFQGNIHRYVHGPPSPDLGNILIRTCGLTNRFWTILTSYLSNSDPVCPERTNMSMDSWVSTFFSVLDHQSANNTIAPSGVLSITPNEDTRLVDTPQRHSTSQTMNLLNMNIKVLIYASS